MKFAFVDASAESFQEPITVDDSVSVGRVDIFMIDGQTDVVS